MTVEVKKIECFKVFNSQNILTKVYENVFFSTEKVLKSHSRKFFRCRMEMLKVSKSFSLHSSTRSRKNYGRTTRRSRDIQLKVEKSEFFKLFNSQNILMKTLENVAFWRKTFFKSRSRKIFKCHMKMFKISKCFY